MAGGPQSCNRGSPRGAPPSQRVTSQRSQQDSAPRPLQTRDQQSRRSSPEPGRATAAMLTSKLGDGVRLNELTRPSLRGAEASWRAANPPLNRTEPNGRSLAHSATRCGSVLRRLCHSCCGRRPAASSRWRDRCPRRRLRKSAASRGALPLPPATPTDTATAARPPRRCTRPTTPTRPSPSTVSHELPSSKHKSSSRAGIRGTADFGHKRP
jgi:hypothetical protein